MFTRKTVFILGAGASWHYGYPTGEGLVKEVIGKTDRVVKFLKEDEQARRTGDFANLQYVQNSYNIEPQNAYGCLKKVRKDFEDLAQRLKQINPPVIDYFLKEHPSLRVIGAMMVAWVIMEREKGYFKGVEDYKSNNCNLNRREQGKNHNVSESNDDWYRFITYKLTSGCKAPQDLLNNHVHFITFNYDMSLDNAVYQRLKLIEYFQTDQIVDAFFKRDIFLHMYGRVRENLFVDDLQFLPDENGSPRSKIGHIKDILDSAYQACNSNWGIKTIDSYNKDDDTDTHKRAQKLIADADDVYILGYGFDANNNEKLDLYNGLRPSKTRKRRIHFTNFGDKQVINKRASKVLFGNPESFHPGDPFVLSNLRDMIATGKQECVYEKSIRDVYCALQDDFDFL